MAYLVLARKSRPALFKEVVGQEAVVRTLRNALQQNRVAHAMIFSGVRGVGKTTLARIMAKALNCENDAPGGEPCNECRSCREIRAGSSVDLVEIDGASNRGIQEIRELKENIRFMPTGSRFKIIIIDEVHMLTTEAFNALLKTLEEPPAHVYFMFATTELHKVPVTILSRCQRYELKRVSSSELAVHFKAVAAAEQVEMDPASLNLIVREAAGSVRDGLSLLDQVFSYCGKKVSVGDVTDMLGLVSQEAIYSIAEALLAGSIDEALQQLDSMYEYGLDLKRFINDLLACFRALVICRVSSQPGSLLELPEEDIDRLGKIAAGHSVPTLTMMFSILLENLEKAGYAARPRFAVEMAFIKAVQVGEVVPVTTLLGHLDELGADSLPGPGKKKLPPERNRAEKQQIEQERAGSPEESEPPAEYSSSVAEDTGDNVPAPGTVNDVQAANPTQDSEQQQPASAVSPDTAQKTPGSDPVTKNVRKQWPGFVEYVRDRKPWMASALQLAHSLHVEGDSLLIRYASAAECGLLKNREHTLQLTEFALDFFQQNFEIRFVLPDAKECEIDPANGPSPQQERQALANDSLVLTAVDIFNGEIGDIRVGPRFRKPMEESGAAENERPDGNE